MDVRHLASRVEPRARPEVRTRQKERDIGEVADVEQGATGESVPRDITASTYTGASARCANLASPAGWSAGTFSSR